MSEAEKRAVRSVSEREMAIALCLEFAETKCFRFSLFAFYDDDEGFLMGLAERLKVPYGPAYFNKLRKVVLRLVKYGVFNGQMRGTAREYIDEPSKQKSYRMKVGKADLIRNGADEKRGIHEPEWEAAFLLRHAYPETQGS